MFQGLSYCEGVFNFVSSNPISKHFHYFFCFTDFFFAGMTVPGARHNLEAGQEESATSQQIRRYRHNRKNGGNGQKFAGLYTGPYFDPSMPNNVSVQLGDTALLICKVNQVGGKTVSTYFTC